MALVNGALVREGDDIEGATVVRIDAYQVELQVGEERFRIPMQK